MALPIFYKNYAKGACCLMQGIKRNENIVEMIKKEQQPGKNTQYFRRIIKKWKKYTMRLIKKGGDNF